MADRAPFPKTVPSALANFFAAGAGPTHTALDGALSAAGFDAVDAPSKASKVQTAFALCESDTQKYALAEELLELLRNEGMFDRENDMVTRARRAFERVGGTLDSQGFVAWPGAEPGPSTPPTSPIPAAVSPRPLNATVRRGGTRPFDGSLSAHTAAIQTANAVAALSRPAESEPSAVDDPRRVAVAYGQDREARDAIFTYLRSLGLHPLEFAEIIAESGSGSPFAGAAIEDAFASVQAIVVLLTPDEHAHLHPELGSEATRLQPRPNVIFEAGLAFAMHPKRTIMVKYGNATIWSNLAGRHYLSMDDSAERRTELKTRLEKAGCAVNPNGTDFLKPGVGGNFPGRNRPITGA